MKYLPTITTAAAASSLVFTVSTVSTVAQKKDQASPRMQQQQQMNMNMNAQYHMQSMQAQQQQMFYGDPSGTAAAGVAYGQQQQQVHAEVPGEEGRKEGRSIYPD